MWSVARRPVTISNNVSAASLRWSSRVVADEHRAQRLPDGHRGFSWSAKFATLAPHLASHLRATKITLKSSTLRNGRRVPDRAAPCIGYRVVQRCGTGTALLIRPLENISSLRHARHISRVSHITGLMLISALILIISAPAALGMATPIVIDHSSARHVPLRTPLPQPLLVGKSIQLWELPKQAMSIPTRLLARRLASASPRDVTLAGVATNILLSGMKVQSCKQKNSYSYSRPQHAC